MSKIKFNQRELKNNKIMNLLNTFRKPYLATLLAFLVLFISCSDTVSNSEELNKFNYATFEDFKVIKK